MQNDDFLEASVDKQDVWLHPPPGQEKHAIEHYILCRNKEPLHSSAIIIVPATGNGIAMPWTPLLKNMVLLRQYDKTDKVLTVNGTRFGTKRGI